MQKKFSLKISWLISKIMRKGRTYHSPFFVVKYSPSKLEYSQFCLTVSAKISKLAVVRNKVKRRLREAIRINMSLLNKPLNIIVLPRTTIIQKSYLEIEEEVKKMMRAISE